MDMTFRFSLPSRIFLILTIATTFPILPTKPIAAAPEDAQELFLVAQKAFEDGFYDVAIRYLTQLLEQFPQTPKRVQANLLLGQCYFFKGQYLKAFEIFQRLSSSSEFKDAILYWLGETYLKGSDYTQAEKQFRRVIEVYPDSVYAPQAYYSLGWTFYEQQQYQAAQDAFLKLHHLYPLHQLSPDGLMKAGECSYNLGRYEEAIQYFKDYLRRYPKSPKHDEVYFYIAEAQYYQGNHKEAIEYYQKAAEISYNPTMAIMSKVSQGWSYLKLKNFPESEKIFEEAQKLAEEKNMLVDDIFLGKANLFSEMGDHAKAVTAYDNLINRFPNSARLAEAYLGKANALYTLEKHPEAIAIYKQLLDQFGSRRELKDVLEKAYFGLAWSYLKIGSIDRAIETFRAVENQSTSAVVKVSALSQIGDAYQDAEDPTKALEVYDKILKEYPESLYSDYVQYRQGVALLKLGRVEAAILSLQSALNKFPKSKYLNDMHYYLGVAYFRQSNWGSAAQQMENFIQNSPPAHELLAEAHYMLAVSSFNLKDVEKALRLFEKIVKTYPAETPLIRNAELGMAQSLYELTKTREALLKYKSIAEDYPGSQAAQDALLELAEHHIDSSDYDTAGQYLYQAIEDFPEGAKTNIARYQLAQIFEAQNKLDKAVEQYKQVSADPAKELYIKAQLGIADIFAKQVESKEAIDQYRKIAENSPEFKRDAYLKVAKIHRNDKNYQAEIKAYAEALRSDIGQSKIKNAELQFYIGETHENLNKAAEAVEAYLKIPYLYPEEKLWSIKAYLRIARIFEDQENWQNAKNIYTKILQYDTDESKYAQERLDWIKNNIESNIH
jgi:tetratricopeptide (TPR) repeat protein